MMTMTSRQVILVTVRGLAAAALVFAAVLAASAQSYEPARFKSGDVPRRAVQEPIQNVAASSPGAPSVVASSMPPYPPTALNSGAVLAEIDIDGKGGAETRIIRATPPFDAVVTDTLRSWRFAPARVAGAAVPSRVFAFFDFPQPALSNSGH
jgi:hypothetical protein